MALPRVLSIRALEKMGIHIMSGKIYVDIQIDGSKYVKVWQKPIYIRIEKEDDYMLLAKD